MPLEHSPSKQAFNRNVDTLMHEVGKSPHVKSRAQALAIAYSIKEPKGRAFGGPTTAMNGMLAQASNPVMLSNGVAPNPAINAVSAGARPMSPMPVPQGAINAASPVSQGIGMPVQLPSSQPSAFPMRKNGGVVPELAFGGLGVVKTPSMNPTWQERNEARSMTRGPILSAVPGRTDAHYTHVPSGSFVIPADIVSAHGEGNTIAGANALSKLFKMGPYGSSMPKLGGRSGMPRAPKLGKLHSGGGKGGTDKHVGTPVPVKLAGGEIVVPPENLMEVVHPHLKTAHEIMDKWVVNERKKLRKTLAKLPPPVKD